MLNLSLQSDREKQAYDICCVKCGKFISRNDIDNNNKAKYHFIPDSECGLEESYWEHTEC